MKTTETIEKPQKTRFTLESRYTQIQAISFMALIIGTTLMFTSDFAAKTVQNGNTNVLYGWIHGSYIIPEFIASLVSSEYAIYQSGGGALYDFAYLSGILFMARTIRVNLMK